MEIVTNLEEILAQEASLQFNEFTASTAFEIGLAACMFARAEAGKPVAVHIELDAYPLFTHFMDGTDADNLMWVTVKKNVVKRFGHSSLYVGLECKSRGTTFAADSCLDENEFRAEGGSFPIVLREKGRIGTITVSGLTGEEDHAIAVAAIRKFLEGQSYN
jgi:uncharacterized protein (UPF0303 family)